eukprot:1152078-Pelagomonas_calceolata.AAC.6
MGERGRGLWNGLLAGEPDAHMDGWLITRRIHTSLVASSYAFSWWGSLSVSALTDGSFCIARWLLSSVDFYFNKCQLKKETSPTEEGVLELSSEVPNAKDSFAFSKENYPLSLIMKQA